MTDINHIITAFALTVAAGLSTVVGSLIALTAKRNNRNFLSVSLGFSAGVMIYVSMVEILAKSREALSSQLGARPGSYLMIASFFAGMLLIALIDKLIPLGVERKTGQQDSIPQSQKLMRMGALTALAIAVHNFPEGLATFVSALQEPSVAIPIVVAIAIHNIPEGIAVSVPIYQATGSRARAFLYSFLSGLAEPVGALAGYMLLLPFMGELAFGVIFAAVAGIMVFISFDGLLPSAREFGDHHLSIYGLMGGMAVMAVSLLLFI